VQIARNRGARVLATARSGDHEFMRSLGAAELYDWTRESVPDRVRAAHPTGVDALLDTVSDSERFAAQARLVRRGGAVTSTVLDLDPARPPVEGVRVASFDVPGTPGLFARVREMLEREDVRIPLEARYPLDRASEAIERLRRGPSRGRVALEIP
jgi:D-arabinose 1-dehydrogenase-like Zn-dependent alcohol dehydrogenase